MNSRFFIENREFFGLWMIYSVVIMLAYAVLDTFFAWLYAKFLKPNKKRKILRAAKQELELKRQLQRKRCYEQVRRVMNDEF